MKTFSVSFAWKWIPFFSWMWALLLLHAFINWSLGPYKECSIKPFPEIKRDLPHVSTEHSLAGRVPPDVPAGSLGSCGIQSVCFYTHCKALGWDPSHLNSPLTPCNNTATGVLQVKGFCSLLYWGKVCCSHSLCAQQGALHQHYYFSHYVYKRA